MKLHNSYLFLNKLPEWLFIFLLIILLGEGMATAQNINGKPDDFVLSAPGLTTNIVVGKKDKEVVRIAARALVGDIRNITGQTPTVGSNPNTTEGAVVMIGTVDDPVIQHYCDHYNLSGIKGKWEHFFIRILNNLNSPSKKVLLIVGSDARGAAYGVFTLSKKIGVSPWKWWADVTPHRKSKIVLDGNLNIAQGPSVKYRGIFINDEDFGLRRWAAETFEPKPDNIGPKIYKKVFELLLRLKANTIWPAMHRGTIPFFTIKRNRELAKKYDIVVGTAHNEPMMCNIPALWKEKKMGSFNYITNRKGVYDFWEQRVKQVADGNNIYTLGMRGTGDSKMKGVSGISQAADVLDKVINDQRGLIKKYVSRDVANVPQVFIPYKEVLPIYDYGLKIPDDVTLMWPDDNYGYIRRLSNQKERQRSGSAGIYYHLSYWGRPHDYLWLSSTQPGLIWEEMKKAWDYGAQRIWIANVGDIKPAAYNIQFFLDMAWNIDSIKPGNIRHHMWQWHARLFGKKNAKTITSVMDEYYRLAFIRKPEFMGWSQTEPTTPTHNTAFHAFIDGDEIARRVNVYKKLIEKVNRIQNKISKDRQDAFFELIAYPVRGAAYMNEKLLYAQKSRLFAKYNLPVANEYARLSTAAYDSIQEITRWYNQVIAQGKWKGIMNSAPRKLPVFDAPKLPEPVHADQNGVLLWLDGQRHPIDNKQHNILPVFNPYSSTRHFIAVFNKGKEPQKWQAITREDWIRLNKYSGILKDEEKIEVAIDWNKIPDSASEGTVSIKTKDDQYTIVVPTAPPIRGLKGRHLLVEQDGRVFIQAGQFTGKHDYSDKHKWTSIHQLGYSNNAYSILPVPKEHEKDLKKAFLHYRFYTYSKGSADITVFTLPTLPVNDSAGIGIALSVDGGPQHAISYKTVGRSEQWKQNVLSNHAGCTLKYNFQQSGWHDLTIYPLDPGVVVDQILVNFKPEEKIYAVPVENNGDQL